MPFLAASVLARLCSTYASLLPDTAAVVRETGTPNGLGGSTMSTATVEASLGARVVPMYQPKVTVEGGSPVVVADYDIYLGDPARLPSALDVRTYDIITVNSITYRVLSTDEGRGESLGLKATCKRLL